VFTGEVKWRWRLPLQTKSRGTQKLFRARSPLVGNVGMLGYRRNALGKIVLSTESQPITRRSENP
jgi:hypothetical protein